MYNADRSQRSVSPGQQPAVRAHLDAPRRAVEHLLFLESRPVRRGVGNLVSAGAGGWVRFWECHAEGELVAQFNAGHRPGASVTALCSDRQQFHFLVTGDTDGYVKVWYLSRYANAGADSEHLARPPRPERFQLLRESMILRILSVQQGRFAPPSSASDPDRTWTAPLLVTAFHAHLNVVTSLDFVDSRDCFLSASDDLSVRMWTVYGAFLGIFGRETPWLPVELPPYPEPKDESRRLDDQSLYAGTGRTFEGSSDSSSALSRPSTAKSTSSEFGERSSARQPRRIPADVRRVASACSLRVIYGGHVPQWKATRAKMLAYVEVYQRIMVISKQRSAMNIADDATSRPAPSDVLLQISELPSIEHSRILGNSYRRQRRYRPLPTVPRVLQNDVKVSRSSASQYTVPYVFTCGSCLTLLQSYERTVGRLRPAPYGPLHHHHHHHHHHH